MTRLPTRFTTPPRHDPPSPYRWLAIGAVFIVGLALAHWSGVKRGESIAARKDVESALQMNAAELKAVSMFDTLAKAADRKATVAVVKHRPKVDSARKQLVVSEDPKDSVIVVVRDTLRMPDTLFSLPVANFIRAATEQMELDSIALSAKDARILTLEGRVALLMERDSLQTIRGQLLETEAKQAGRRGFWKGAATGAGVTVLAVLGLLIL